MTARSAGLVSVDTAHGIRWAKPRSVRGRSQAPARPVIEPLPGKPRTPASLGRSGKRAFSLVAGERWPTITPAELPILKRYASLHDLMDQCMTSIREEGLLVAGSRGQAVSNPAIDLMTTLLHECRQHERMLGLSPAHRVRLSIEVATLEGMKETTRGARPRAEAPAGRGDAPDGWRWCSDDPSDRSIEEVA